MSETQKAEYERDSIIEQVSAKLDVVLLCDFERFRNGSVPIGFSLGTFDADGLKGSIGSNGESLSIHLNNRTWKVSLADILSAVIDADAQYQQSTVKQG